ncbi:hypothetical protein UFOVP238_51 [uncultured Caudovirales phage]|uniref:Uncharacterized protein n=1 Tax=uncultured Caudovirales phage TaxID=2100421 RepID=A0A6J7WR99_9CAUD|nr:hypothetical protein UFOVP238_51 [uncultured Caudovirales phage]
MTMPDTESVINQLKAAQGALYAASIAVECALDLIQQNPPESRTEQIRDHLYDAPLMETMGQPVIHDEY